MALPSLLQEYLPYGVERIEESRLVNMDGGMGWWEEYEVLRRKYARCKEYIMERSEDWKEEGNSKST